ncbi:MAG: phosphate transport system permease protein, partial [Chloroflexota bacterium]|nr:phosphate transport system permease protein [Chloroflexota bacterium]
MTHLTLRTRSRQGSGRLADLAFRGSSRLAAATVVVILLLITLLLALNSGLTWQTFGLSFITGQTWDPVAGIFGALPFIVGTILAASFAIIVAAPIGILTAIFLSELAPRRVATPLTFMIELLAAIPSVVIGLWGIFILAPFLRDTVEAWIVSVFSWIPFLGGPAHGIGLFTAATILAIMVLPT